MLTDGGCAVTGIGLEAAKFLAGSGDWHVIMAVRSFAKAEASAKEMGMDESTYTVMDLDLASLNSVRNFVKALKGAKIKPDALVCNAAVWYPKVCRRVCVLANSRSVRCASYLLARVPGRLRRP